MLLKVYTCAVLSLNGSCRGRHRPPACRGSRWSVGLPDTTGAEGNRVRLGPIVPLRSCAYRMYRVPTLLATNDSGNWRAISCVARHPVQCWGTMTLGLKSFSDSIVEGMMGSKIAPVRWNPPITA